MEKNSGAAIGISKPEGDTKGVILKLRCESFGDSLCATPTLRKLYEAYGKKIIVCSYKPFIFKNNPYVEYHIHAHEFDEKLRDEYEILETFQVDKDWDYVYGNGTKMKYGSVDIRKLHCTNLGFDLKPSEMHCEYYPDPVNFKESDRSFINNESYIVIHISQTWPSRTWAQSNYEELIKKINRAGYKVALIGFDTPKENNDYSKDCYNLDHLEFDGVSFLNRTSLDQDFEIIKKANICVTCDTGILHLSGCTETEIIYIGGSIDPIWRAPYRHGGQTYKFSFVGGSCDIFCASNVKYCISEHGSFNSLPRISECLENKPTYECHPTHEQVFNKIAEVSARNFEEHKEVKKEKKLKRVLIDFRSSALGDTVAWIPYVEEYRIKNNCEVFCSTFHNSLFKEVYPEINFIEPGSVVSDIQNTIHIGWINNEGDQLTPPMDVRKKELQRTASFLLGLDEHIEIKPKIHIKNKERKIKDRYVCIATQSTAQAKYWNNKDGWQKTVEHLNLLGYKVVCIDRNSQFGIEGQYNYMPKGVIDKTGDSPLEERVNQLYNCEFFIGLPSGLSWLAWALNKEVVLISGFSNEQTEFFTPYRVINKNVCNSCWNKEEFDAGNWNWCPDHEGTERQHECTKSISFEDVKSKIDSVANFVNLKNRNLIDFSGLTQNIFKLGDKAVDEESLTIQWNEIFMKDYYGKVSRIKEGDIVLDIGANIGFVTAYAMWKGASKCYSIEPMPKNFNILKKWVNSSEHKDKIKLLNKALSDRPVALPNEPEIINEWTPSVTNLNIGEKTFTGESIKIESLKLSDFFNQYPDEEFDFVKLDCEGGEWCLLNNEKELDLFFKKVRNVVMEIHLRDAFFKDFDYSFGFVEKFKMNGFKAQVKDASAEVDITDLVVNNKILPDKQNAKAHDYFNQVLFYAKKI
tara:strand:+ start:835 stop:3582 length:2748 start_codon:yes stop_codon:yes gene_type:complete